MVDKKRVAGKGPGKPSDEQRCQHVYEDGRRCGNWRWAGKKVCYLHDEEVASSRKHKPKAAAAATSGRNRIMTAAEVHELLATMLAQVVMGELPVGRAYAIGYLAQLMLAAQKAAAQESKMDVKHFWEMVDLVDALERAKESLAEKERKRKEAESLASAREEEAGEVEETEGAQE